MTNNRCEPHTFPPLKVQEGADQRLLPQWRSPDPFRLNFLRLISTLSGLSFGLFGFLSTLAALHFLRERGWWIRPKAVCTARAYMRSQLASINKLKINRQHQPLNLETQ
ncbi:hypothetical protein MCOR13_003765 [Pyricularia oryzae]|nr:hypothetical protein MCOR13_003765 [Pyricularia oryzae]